MLEEARSGCSTEKLQEKLDQLEADQKEAQTVMEYRISKAKHEGKGLRGIWRSSEVGRNCGTGSTGPILWVNKNWLGWEGAHAASTPAEEAKEFLENQVGELTTQKPESEATEPQPQDPELTNSSTVFSPQIQNAEAAEPEMASAELSDLNSDVSAEDTLDSKIWE